MCETELGKALISGLKEVLERTKAGTLNELPC